MNKLKLVTDFLEFEKDNNLFDWTVCDIKMWGFVRHMYYTALKTAKTGLDIPLQSKSKKRSYIAFIKSLKYVFGHKYPHKTDILFMSHPRRIKQPDGKYYCIYTDYLNNIVSNKYSTTFIEEPYWHEYIGIKDAHYSPIPAESVLYTDREELLYFIKKSIFKCIHPKKFKHIKTELMHISNLFENRFEMELGSFNELLFDWMLYPILMMRTYDKVLNRISPKIIIAFYSPSPFRNTMVYLANSKNIPVVEMQHGVYGTENIFYKFAMPLKYSPLPDYIFTLGKRLFDTRFFVFSDVDNHVIPTGSLCLNKKLEMTKYDKGNTKNILIISQGNLNKEFRKFTKELADLIKDEKDWNILYKKHPYETSADYKDLKHSKITVIENNDHDIFYYMTLSCCQIGAYSTAIYEGVALGLPTFILSDLYCADDTFDILRDIDGVYNVKNANDVYERLFNTNIRKPNKKSINNIWTPVNPTNILENISNIINNQRNA